MVDDTRWTTAELNAAIDRADPTGANLLVTLLIRSQQPGTADSRSMNTASSSQTLLDRGHRLCRRRAGPGRRALDPRLGSHAVASGTSTARIADDIPTPSSAGGSRGDRCKGHFVDITGICSAASMVLTMASTRRERCTGCGPRQPLRAVISPSRGLYARGRLAAPQRETPSIHSEKWTARYAFASLHRTPGTRGQTPAHCAPDQVGDPSLASPRASSTPLRQSGNRRGSNSKRVAILRARRTACRSALT